MRIYMDNAATTRVTEPVLEAMLPYLTEYFGNPSSIHGFGRDARRAVDRAREQTAAALGAEPSEIYFTGCGTESDNWAIRGAAYACRDKGRHIVTSSIEHHAVLHTCQQLEKEGFSVTYLPVDEYGRVRPADLEKAMREDTILVSVMTANNEIGTLQPVAELAAIARAGGALFHTDAVQAIGSVPIDVKKLDIDLLSLSGHKFHAPKGVGALYIRDGVRLRRLMYGGEQERVQRPGTENVASIAGMGKAIELATARMEEHNRLVSGLRDRMVARVLNEIPKARLNGHPTERLPGNANFSFEGVEGEALLLNLDFKGVAASSGSACTAGSPDISHVLLAIGLPEEIARSSLRLSLGEENTREECDYAVDCLKEIVARLRRLSQTN